MKVLVNRAWEEKGPENKAGLAPKDKMAARMIEENGRVKELVWVNGGLVIANEYPAGTEYMKRRMAILTK